MFTREDTSSLPLPETKYNGTEGERLGQLVVTPELVANKITNMKDNKSPGVDGIAPKLLKETVEQISMPLVHVFNMSLQEGIVPLEWKEANTIPLLKIGSRNKSVNYRPVSLTSVICKLLETILIIIIIYTTYIAPYIWPVWPFIGAEEGPPKYWIERQWYTVEKVIIVHRLVWRDASWY